MADIHQGHSALGDVAARTLAIGVFSLAIVAAVWSCLYPGLSHYPVSWLDQSPPSLFWGGWNE